MSLTSKKLMLLLLVDTKMPINMHCYNLDNALDKPKNISSTLTTSIFDRLGPSISGANVTLSQTLNFIKEHSDSKENQKFVSFTKTLRRHALYVSQKKFLTNCRSHDVLPHHIQNSCQSIRNLSFFSNPIKRKNFYLFEYLHKKILNLEISDIHIHINSLKKQIESKKI